MSEKHTLSFKQQALKILNLSIEYRVNQNGGYGPGGEVIYDSHPAGCPSVLVDQKNDAKAAFMSNGSTSFEVKLANGKEVKVLTASFNALDKREFDVPSQNVWIRLAGKDKKIASLINPYINLNLEPEWIKIVKLGDPYRAMWYCSGFSPEPGLSFRTAVKLALVHAENGLEDPGRVRSDLVHAFSLMYVTCEHTPALSENGLTMVREDRLTLVEKLHGMFPRQYPSSWLDRSKECGNDNRPYSDSPLWLIKGSGYFGCA